MKINKHVTAGLAVLFFVIMVLAAPALVLAEKQDQKKSEEQQKIEELWKKYTFPGEKHKHLDYFVGEWESVQKLFRKSGEAVTRKQEITVVSLFQGRFTKAHIKIKADIMGIAPEGIVINGYDNYKEEFFSITFGNLGTEYFLTSGKLDKDGKVRIDRGDRKNIYTGEEYKIKAVTTIIDRDNYVYEYYRIASDGNERKTMEITYKRKKVIK
ncbi:MAG: DUF1579 domain-containing protein [Candidatus Aminicenantes bacterium]|nr:DUF1579 domain-containing protein [Candidatus Aminicenantes bacterium]NIM79386.1 DUF1579 domain-containing protein [Candidatus Aminicenantes bacterium]NIN18663.1 DUF1579 domain-containing protein [Candidatus Aminicenantes bacterium]NIN42552.1 DUF1579 domain-containing protein [Candidatus Aminicenantes bacterium]NIN85318.1 DUF1579 domain-containing protein [Candidatus Aminicenantes bacterium]